MYSALFGWKPIDKEILEYVKHNRKGIALYAHTSNWDHITILSYLFDNYELRNKFHAIVRDKTIYKFPTNYIYQNYIVPIPVKMNERNKGIVDKIAEDYKTKDDYYIFMSPEGACEKQEWKPGYLALSLKLQVPIIVIGFDYHQHKIRLIGDIDLKVNNDDNKTILNINYFEKKYNKSIVLDTTDFNLIRLYVEPKLQNMMSEIIPLNKEQSYVDVDNKFTSCIGNSTYNYIFLLLFIIFIILLLIILFKK